jgi:zinc D-Ala-D-Ala dipeptidase
MVDWTRRIGRKDRLRDGHIFSRSRHNLGLVIDLTLIERSTAVSLRWVPHSTHSLRPPILPMPGGDIARNRALFNRLMEAEGFVNYEKEWWHFSFDAPNPVRFDIVAR